MLWQVTLLALVVWAMDILLRRRGWPQVRYALWLLVLLRLFIPPSFSLPSSVSARLLPAGGPRAAPVVSETPMAKGRGAAEKAESGAPPSADTEDWGEAAEGVQDRPRPEIWKTYPALKDRLDAGLASLPDWLKMLEPESFAQNYPGIAKMAESKDLEERLRALKAIEALREMSGLPILVAAIDSAESKERRRAALRLSNWVYDEYHTAGRMPPARFAPLLPLFVKTLVEAGDEPNVRAYCFQAIGSLAGPEWLPLVKDLSASRHPAVTHWSGWAAEQLSQRPGEDAPWGEAMEGVQVRLRGHKKVWQAGEVPTFKADVRNGGARQLSIAAAPERGEIEFDGLWRSWRGEVEENLLPLGPGQQYGGIRMSLEERWRSKVAKGLGMACDLQPGQHTVRVAFFAHPVAADEGRSVRVQSNPVEITIERALPGSRLSVGQAVAAPHFAFAAVCEALSEPQLKFGEIGVGYGFQEFRVMEVLGGDAAAPEPVKLRYDVLNERGINKGERIIWIICNKEFERRMTPWVGIKALPDTPENRKAVIEAAKEEAAWEPVADGIDGPLLPKTAEGARTISVVEPPLGTPLEPYASVGDAPSSICETDKQGLFIIGTTGVDSIRSLEPDELVHMVHDFEGDPGPACSCWWRGRFCMGFVNHGRILIGDIDGEVSYVDTGARQILGMVAADDGALVACATFVDARNKFTFSLIRLEKGGKPEPFVVFAEGVDERRGKPTGIIADEGGGFVVCASYGTEQRHGVLYRVESDGRFRLAYTGLTGPRALARWDPETILVTEFDFEKFPYGGRLLALDRSGRATVVAKGFLGLSQLCLAADGSLLITEHGAGMVKSRSIFRLTSEQIGAALQGRTHFVATGRAAGRAVPSLPRPCGPNPAGGPYAEDRAVSRAGFPSPP